MAVHRCCWRYAGFTRRGGGTLALFRAIFARRPFQADQLGRAGRLTVAGLASARRKRLGPKQ